MLLFTKHDCRTGVLPLTLPRNVLIRGPGIFHVRRLPLSKHSVILNLFQDLPRTPLKTTSVEDPETSSGIYFVFTKKSPQGINPRGGRLDMPKESPANLLHLPVSVVPNMRRVTFAGTRRAKTR